MLLALQIILGIAAALAVILIVLAILIANRTYNVTCYHSDSAKARHNDPHIEFGEEQYKNLTGRIHALVSSAEEEKAEDVKIRSSHDGTELYGRFYRFSDSNIVNIFFHGYRGTALRDGCGCFDMCRKNGMNALFVDQRANGRSGGNVITFGILERLDCRDWVNYINERFNGDVKIVLSGVSLGAATVLNASDLDLKNVRCIIADCGFTSPKEIICKVASEGGYPVSICWPLLKISCKLRAHFDLEETSAVEAVAKTSIPIMIIHGDDDRYVPFEMGEKLYEACASEKRFLRVKGAPHAASYMVDTEGYVAASMEFIGKHLEG